MSNILSIPIRQLPTYNTLALIVINFVAVSLVIIVLNHKRFGDGISKIFILLGFSMLAWVDFAYLARIYGLNYTASLFFLKLAWVATPILFYSTYLASTYLMGKLRHKYINWVAFIVTILLSGTTAISALVIKDVSFTNNTLDIVYGQGFYPFLLGISLLMLFTVEPMFHTKLISKVKVFLFGVIVFYIANAIFNIALPLFWGVTHLYFIGDYSTIFLLVLTAYAIVRHKLFDIKIATTEVVTVLLWIILFSRLFVAQNVREIAIDGFVFSLAVVFGILLIRSVIREIEQREKLEELTGRLRAMDQQKDEFISMAAHELRAPMTAVKGYLSMVMEGDTGDIPEKARGFLADANAINERLIRLVNNMLNVSRIEEGRMVYQVEIENLSQVVRTVFAQFKPEAERKGLEYTLEIPSEIRDSVEVDPDRIYEVVANLLSNAVKYTDKGYVKVFLTQPDENSVRCEVKDTGPGVSKEEQTKLFQKFHRVESNVGKTTGTGLGLYICKLLVEKFGGKISLESDTGKGSNFWFQLPLKQKSAA